VIADKKVRKRDMGMLKMEGEDMALRSSDFLEIAFACDFEVLRH
jgi:hypothetical protein